jgi:hypothetical protein
MMNLAKGFALAFFAPVVIPASASLLAAPFPVHEAAIAQDVAQPRLTGSWTGSLLQRDWSFNFVLENGAWVGTYKTPDGKVWHPLADLVVKDNAITFAITSKPKISFALGLDDNTAKLSGTAKIEGVATVPFSAMHTR